ncbi:MAG: radical SAM protein [Acidobacteria bacterium]|nr:radical SAM protein [Acidobacteriota bacterium]
MEGIIPAWGRILRGYRPSLSIEITRECPLRCPGCYAYGDEHLGGGNTLRSLADFKGQALIDGILDAVRVYKPIHLSLVGGEPLVRFRELDVLLPRLSEMGIYTQVVTSAVRPIPREWAGLRRLQICVSIDGLQPEHDVRRTPATYDRILKHIDGHQITVHCTVTRQQVQRDGYIEAFITQWSANPNVKTIWMSLYTPQVDEESDERLRPEDRARVVSELRVLRERFPKLQMPKGLLNAYLDPPESPADCIFAQTTDCISADLTTKITPCQFGGTPDCSSCGCMASAALAAVGRHTLPGGVRVGAIFNASFKVGEIARSLRRPPTVTPPRPVGDVST